MTIDEAFNQFPVLTTPRLLLRQVEMSDAEDLFATLSDVETMRFYNVPYQSLEDAQVYIQMRQENYANRVAIRWGISLKDSDRIIGSLGFHHFDEGYHHAETGYILNRAHWGQGIMPEALSAIITYGFATMALHRIEAIIDIANERSKGVLLKLGFQYEGNLRQRYAFRDRFEDEHYFGLLRDEWQAHLAGLSK